MKCANWPTDLTKLRLPLLDRISARLFNLINRIVHGLFGQIASVIYRIGGLIKQIRIRMSVFRCVRRTSLVVSFRLS